jgi:hypothetical protein
MIIVNWKFGGVALDKNEGVVKAQFCSAVLCAPRGCQSRVEDQDSGNLAVNHFSVDRSTNHRYGPSLRP